MGLNPGIDRRDRVMSYLHLLVAFAAVVACVFGVRDAGLLESALTRPVNRWNYGEDDPAELAAAYAFGVARNHPFIDGNKRTAWVLARLFLAVNGHKLAFTSEDAIRMMLALAAGELEEDGVSVWFRERLT